MKKKSKKLYPYEILSRFTEAEGKKLERLAKQNSTSVAEIIRRKVSGTL